MSAEAIMLALKAAGWSVAGWNTDRGQMEHAERDGHKLTVCAPRVALAWLVLWMKLSGPMALSGAFAKSPDTWGDGSAGCSPRPL
jgi:hypothetical protein